MPQRQWLSPAPFLGLIALLGSLTVTYFLFTYQGDERQHGALAVIALGLLVVAAVAVWRGLPPPGCGCNGRDGQDGRDGDNGRDNLPFGRT